VTLHDARCATMFLQEYLDFASYLLNLSYSSYDLTQHLDGQPLQVIPTPIQFHLHWSLSILVMLVPSVCGAV
jgi:hypothetical protein